MTKLKTDGIINIYIFWIAGYDLGETIDKDSVLVVNTT